MTFLQLCLINVCQSAEQQHASTSVSHLQLCDKILSSHVITLPYFCSPIFFFQASICLVHFTVNTLKSALGLCPKGTRQLLVHSFTLKLVQCTALQGLYKWEALSYTKLHICHWNISLTLYNNKLHYTHCLEIHAVCNFRHLHANKMHGSVHGAGISDLCLMTHHASQKFGYTFSYNWMRICFQTDIRYLQMTWRRFTINIHDCNTMENHWNQTISGQKYQLDKILFTLSDVTWFAISCQES